MKANLKRLFFENHFEMFWLYIKPGIQERGTECGGRGKWENVIFQGILSNVPGNVFKHFEECHQTFRECLQIFRGMSSNIPENVGNHSGECPQTI